MRNIKLLQITFVLFFLASCGQQISLPDASAKEMQDEHMIHAGIPVVLAEANVDHLPIPFQPPPLTQHEWSWQCRP